MIGTMIGLGALLAAQTAPAMLWENVAPGMPAEQARALYPAGGEIRHRADRIVIGGHDLVAGCSAEANVHLGGRAVERVQLRGKPALLGRCGGEVLEALVARYGAPDAADGKGDTPFTRSRETYVWRRDEMELRFVRYTSPGYAGSGLTRPSWILTYARAGAES